MAKNQAIYVRLPADVQERLDSYSTGLGMKTSTAASELLRYGLDYIAQRDAIEKQKQQNIEMEKAKRDSDERANKLDAELQRVRTELTTRMNFWEHSYSKLCNDLTAMRNVAPCPYQDCNNRSLSAYDLVLNKQCPTCNRPVAWNPEATNNDGIRNVLAAVGAVATMVLVGKWLSEPGGKS